jgi:hypothetical protein
MKHIASELIMVAKLLIGNDVDAIVKGLKTGKPIHGITWKLNEHGNRFQISGTSEGGEDINVRLYHSTTYDVKHNLRNPSGTRYFASVTVFIGSQSIEVASTKARGESVGGKKVGEWQTKMAEKLSAATGLTIGQYMFTSR